MGKFRRIAERFMAARFHEALSGMTDRQLADIGVTRETIRQRAQELARLR